MKVSLAVVADSAQVDASQKLSILGVFDRINATQFPMQHPSMALALRVSFDHADAERRHAFRIRLLDEDGRIKVEGQAETAVGPIPVGELGSVALAINLLGTPFARPGQYHFEITGDSLESPANVPFTVALVDPPTP